MPGRKFNGGDYRYGCNGKENDNEIKGEGNHLDFGGYMINLEDAQQVLDGILSGNTEFIRMNNKGFPIF